jgi:hypothetical protein
MRSAQFDYSSIVIDFINIFLGCSVKYQIPTIAYAQQIHLTYQFISVLSSLTRL